MIINCSYSEFLTTQEQYQTALLKQIKADSTFSHGTWNSSPVGAVEFKTGILMKKGILFFSCIYIWIWRTGRMWVIAALLENFNLLL